MGTASIKTFFKNVLGTLTEEAALTTSAGAGDADRIPALNADGVLDLTITNGTNVSAGASDAGKLAALDAAGLLDVTMMPPNAGSPVLAFTDLTDGPGTISPGLLLVGKADGTGVEFLASNNALRKFGTGPADEVGVDNNFNLETYAFTDYSAPTTAFGIQTYNTPSTDTAYTQFSLVSESAAAPWSAHLYIYTEASPTLNQVAIERSSSSTFKMAGFDVVAYDENARLTVDGTQYGIDKAIPVKINNVMYYWPLFNGESAAGPAPPPVLAFTGLTDAPTSIVANGFVVGKADETGVEFLPGNELRLLSTGPTGDNVNNTFYFSAYTDAGLAVPDGAVNFWAAAHPLTDTGIGSLELLADSSLGNANLKIQATATATAVEINLQKDSTSDFSMVNFDVVASDSAARLMVDGTQYGIDAAIKVKISGVTHYWPLFNGETEAGDAPSGPITVVGRSVQLNLDALNYDAGMDGGPVGLNAGNGGMDHNGGSFAITAGAGYGTGIGGDLELTAGDSDSGRANINLTGGAININNTTAVATQSVAVPGTATLGFTHGLLTSYDDSSPLPLFDGAYASLTGAPTLFSGAYGDLTGLPTLFDGAYGSLTGAPALFDGAYGSLTGAPAISGTNTGDQTSVTGNAGTATALQTARAINGVDFDGTAPITITALDASKLPLAGGTMSGQILSTFADALRIDNSAGYVSAFNTAGTTRTGYIQFNAGGAIIYAAENGAFHQWGVGGATRMTLDTSGNVGIGVTPLAWNASYLALEIGASGSAAVWGGGGSAFIGSNTNINAAGAWARTTASLASMYQQTAGIHSWYSDATGAAGSTFTPTLRLRIDASGNVGIGSAPLTWNAGYKALQIGVAGGAAIMAAANESYWLTNTSHNGTNWVRTTANPTSHYFQASGTHQWYSDATGTAGATFTPTERMRIDAGGNLLVGTGTALLSAATRGNVTINGSSDSIVNFGIGGASAAYVFASSASLEINAVGARYIQFTTNSVEHMRIDASGTVSQTSATSPNLVLRSTTASSYTSLRLYNDQNSSGRALEIDYMGSTYSGGEQGNISCTGLYPLIFGTNNTERMRIDSIGNVGIGSTPGGSRLNVFGSPTAYPVTTSMLCLTNTAATGQSAFDMVVNGTIQARIRADYTGGVVWMANSVHAWFTGGDAGTGTERARITGGGDFLVGKTAAGFINANSCSLEPGGGAFIGGHASGTAAGTGYAWFVYNTTAIGSISQNGTTQVLYNVTSDRRLKTNIADAPDAGALIDAIRVRAFDWKAAPDEHMAYGLIAQELISVAPQAVTQGGDDADTQPWGVDPSKLVPLLVRELQSLRARVRSLETLH